jgi:hypothetical protein
MLFFFIWFGLGFCWSLLAYNRINKGLIGKYEKNRYTTIGIIHRLNDFIILRLMKLRINDFLIKLIFTLTPFAFLQGLGLVFQVKALLWPIVIGGIFALLVQQRLKV